MILFEKNKEKISEDRRVFEKENGLQIGQLFNWTKSLEKSYKNCKDRTLLLYENDKIKAVFPFFLLKSNLFGNRIVSVPFLDVGGFAGEYSKEDIGQVLEILKKERGLRKIEIRLNDSLKEFEKINKILSDLGFKREDAKYQLITELTSKEDIWSKFHKHTRNDVRKAEKSGLVIKKMDFLELKKFYKIYFNEMKNFGTPQHSFSYFKNAFELMEENVIGFNCYFKENLIGSLILFFNKKWGYVAFNVSDNNFHQYRPNDLLYWNAILQCLEKGIKFLDFGQVDIGADDKSRADNLFRFKKKWLGKTSKKFYFYFNLNEKHAQENENEKKEKSKKFRKIWKKLPSFIIKLIGPKICSELGV